MKLSIGQKKALVIALVFGAKEVTGKSWAALCAKGLAAGGNIAGGLTQAGVDAAVEQLRITSDFIVRTSIQKSIQGN